LAQFERGIRLLLPKFQKLLQALQDPERPPSHEQVMQATKTRKRLTDSFIQYETAARRIRDFPTKSPTQARLQKAVHQQAASFLHLHMLPLKSLPKILKHASPHGAAGPSRLSSSNSITTTKATPNALASIRFNDIAETGSQVSSRSSAIESMEAEEKDLRERLIVLEEQKFIVNEMLTDARKRRKFDEVQSLSLNVDDLTREIDVVNGQLAQLDFATAYGGLAGTASPVPPE
jgi:rabenosyn-5